MRVIKLGVSRHCKEKLSLLQFPDINQLVNKRPKLILKYTHKNK